MSLSVKTLSSTALEVSVDGKLHKQDYAELVPQAEKTIRDYGHVNLLVRVANLGGWTPAALWEDLKFDAKHYGDVGRLAIVGKDESKEWLATVSRPFTRAEVHFYPEREIDRARRWVQG